MYYLSNGFIFHPETPKLSINFFRQVLYLQPQAKRFMDTNDDLKVRKSAGPADHLANERTFLAWIRTSIALMGFGFVIVKFALFIRQISVALGNKVPVPGKGYSAVIGVIMVALGAIMATLPSSGISI